MNVNLVAPPTAIPGEIATTTITLENSSQVVRELRLSVLGITGWVEISPDVLKLFPGDLGKATLRFRPPATPDVAAGEHPFAVRCVATDNNEVHVEESIVRVAPHSEVSLRLRPNCARATRSATYQLRVSNVGNQRERFHVRIDDENDILNLAADPASVDLAAGRCASIRLKAVNTTAQPGENLPFRVEVSSATGAASVATASLTIRAGRLRKAAPIIAAGVAITLVAAALWPSGPKSHAVDAALPPTTVALPTTTILATTTTETTVAATTPPTTVAVPTTTSTPVTTTVAPPPTVAPTTSTQGLPSRQPETPTMTTTAPTPPAPAPAAPPAAPAPTTTQASTTTSSSTTTTTTTTTAPPKPPQYSTENVVVYFHVDPNGIFNFSSNCQMIHSPTESAAYTSPVIPGWTIDTTKGDPGHPGISDILDGSNSQARGTLILYNYQPSSPTTFAVTGQVCGSSNAGPGAIFSHTYQVFLTRPAP